MTLLSYAAVCAAAAYVCSCVKEDEGPSLAIATVKLFFLLVFGIGAFAGVIQVFTILAG